MSHRAYGRLIAGIAAAVLALVGCAADQTGPSAKGDARSLTSANFSFPLKVDVPEGWFTLDTSEAVVVASPLESGLSDERLVIFRTLGGTIPVEVFSEFSSQGVEEGRPVSEPWPDDFGAWLDRVDMFEVTGESEATVAGHGATIFQADSSFEPPPSLEDIGDLRIILVDDAAEGTDVRMLAGEMSWNFVLFDDLDVVIAYGGRTDRFSPERFDTFLDSLTVGPNEG